MFSLKPKKNKVWIYAKTILMASWNLNKNYTKEKFPADVEPVIFILSTYSLT